MRLSKIIGTFKLLSRACGSSQEPYKLSSMIPLTRSTRGLSVRISIFTWHLFRFRRHWNLWIYGWTDGQIEGRLNKGGRTTLVKYTLIAAVIVGQLSEFISDPFTWSLFVFCIYDIKQHSHSTKQDHYWIIPVNIIKHDWRNFSSTCLLLLSETFSISMCKSYL